MKFNLDPYSYFNKKSAHCNNDRNIPVSEDKSYLFHTDYIYASPGFAKVDIKFRGLITTSDNLAKIRIRMHKKKLNQTLCICEFIINHNSMIGLSTSSFTVSIEEICEISILGIVDDGFPCLNETTICIDCERNIEYFNNQLEESKSFCSHQI